MSASSIQELGKTPPPKSADHSSSVAVGTLNGRTIIPMDELFKKKQGCNKCIKTMCQVAILAPKVFLSVAGWFVGFAFGGNVGAALGSAAGTAVGSAMSFGIELIIRRHYLNDQDTQIKSLAKEYLKTAALNTATNLCGGLVFCVTLQPILGAALSSINSIAAMIIDRLAAATFSLAAKGVVAGSFAGAEKIYQVVLNRTKKPTTEEPLLKEEESPVLSKDHRGIVPLNVLFTKAKWGSVEKGVATTALDASKTVCSLLGLGVGYAIGSIIGSEVGAMVGSSIGDSVGSFAGAMVAFAIDRRIRTLLSDTVTTEKNLFNSYINSASFEALGSLLGLGLNRGAQPLLSTVSSKPDNFLMTSTLTKVVSNSSDLGAKLILGAAYYGAEQAGRRLHHECQVHPELSVG